MQRLILVRHGITAWNKDGRFQGHSDIELSAEGETQARALGERLKKYDFDTIYSSPLKRAFTTAQLALAGRNILSDERLKELNFGCFEGYTLEENARHSAWSDWQEDPFKQAPPGGESYEALRERAVAWLSTLKLNEASAERRTIIAFSHSGTIQMLLSHLIGVEYPRWRKRFYLRHSSLSSILFQDGHAVIEGINDAKHLEDGAYDPFND